MDQAKARHHEHFLKYPPASGGEKKKKKIFAGVIFGLG
jgi:hypothetical protein